MQTSTFPNDGVDMPSRTTWSILVPTFAVSGLLLIVGLGGAWYVHQANREVSDSLDENLAAAQAAERLVLAIRELRLDLDRFSDTGDVANLDAAAVAFGAAKDEWNGSQSREPLEEAMDEVRYDEFADRLERLREQPGSDPQRAAALELIASLNRDLLTPAETELNERQTLTSETSRQNRAVARRFGFGLLLLALCGAVAGLLAGFGVARSVYRSLVEISVPVRDIAGRLDEVVGPIKVSSNADLSELDESLRMLADKTADVVRRLQVSQQQSVRHEQLAAVGQLAAGLAHELRNPLMSIKLIVQTAAERADESISRRDLVVVEGEITRLEKLLQTFLDFARPPQPEKHPLAIRPLIERTLDVVRPRADQQDVQLHYSPGDESPWVEGDESQVQQVFLNLLLNALDVLPGGGNVWLDVRDDTAPANRLPANESTSKLLAATSGDGQAANLPHVVVQVADDGPGISAVIADRVFDPFVSTKDNGIGLGLSICRQIVESHAGQIAVQNRNEGGAEFTIRLPQLLNHELSPTEAWSASASELPPSDIQTRSPLVRD